MAFATGCHAASGVVELRVLRPPKLADGPTEKALGRGPYVGVAMDVETTGLDVARGKINELALRRFRYDDAGTSPISTRATNGVKIRANL